jgi:tRNA (adenine57-N1/adenine58-N1)-methyltransferase
VELWTPGALGERSTSAKRLRKTARHAGAAAEAAKKASQGDAPDAL